MTTQSYLLLHNKKEVEKELTSLRIETNSIHSDSGEFLSQKTKAKLAKKYAKMARCYMMLEDFIEAKEYSQASLELYRELNKAPSELWPIMNLNALILYKNGCLEEALDNYCDPILKENNLHGTHCPDQSIIDCYFIKGAILAEQGKYSRSISYLKKSVGLLEEYNKITRKASESIFISATEIVLQMLADGANLSSDDILFARENLQKAIEIMCTNSMKEKLLDIDNMINELSEYQNEAGKAVTASNWVDKIKQQHTKDVMQCSIL
jgi:tetratricopeptide (TPR) repeat protein